MARLEYMDPLDVDGLAEIGHSERRHPFPSNLSRLLSYSPGAGRRLVSLGGWLRFSSSLDPRLRELALIQVGYITRTVYEYTHHIEIGLSVGVTPADITGLQSATAGHASGLDPAAATVLSAVRSLTTDAEIPDDLFGELRTHLSDEHVVDLLMNIGLYNGIVRLLRALAIDLEPEYDKYLIRFPLPAEPEATSDHQETT
ncbi:carboxymuconolactone decarboxylase family protein [Williamsia maris]|uniref:Carboxymuconolactone decarboxylase family protein n=1 Tax=Williamsia maris TaxID=72806 RepID=A0ABT1HJI8_9NOCA|nr:carboxymuconolactone decarboxylase family protein [Williamsia maris]MCP2178091.1 Carboxymuconolactone decarboxylase family protein [Williamsia maris]